jgi:hypothetical protein
MPSSPLLAAFGLLLEQSFLLLLTLRIHTWWRSCSSCTAVFGDARSFFFLFSPRNCQWCSGDFQHLTASSWLSSSLSSVFCRRVNSFLFTRYTDHRLLLSAVGLHSPPWSASQPWQLTFVVEFTPDFRQKPRATNVDADVLSRSSPGPVSPHLRPPFPPSQPWTVFSTNSLLP